MDREVQTEVCAPPTPDRFSLSWGLAFFAAGAVGSGTGRPDATGLRRLLGCSLGFGRDLRLRGNGKADRSFQKRHRHVRGYLLFFSGLVSRATIVVILTRGVIGIL
jgi:hypothetical protein